MFYAVETSCGRAPVHVFHPECNERERQSLPLHIINNDPIIAEMEAMRMSWDDKKNNNNNQTCPAPANTTTTRAEPGCYLAPVSRESCVVWSNDQDWRTPGSHLYKLPPRRSTALWWQSAVISFPSITITLPSYQDGPSLPPCSVLSALTPQLVKAREDYFSSQERNACLLQWSIFFLLLVEPGPLRPNTITTSTPISWLVWFCFFIVLFKLKCWSYHIRCASSP